MPSQRQESERKGEARGRGRRPRSAEPAPHLTYFILLVLEPGSPVRAEQGLGLLVCTSLADAAAGQLSIAELHKLLTYQWWCKRRLVYLTAEVYATTACVALSATVAPSAISKLAD